MVNSIFRVKNNEEWTRVLFCSWCLPSLKFSSYLWIEFKRLKPRSLLCCLIPAPLISGLLVLTCHHMHTVYTHMHTNPLFGSQPVDRIWASTLFRAVHYLVAYLYLIRLKQIQSNIYPVRLRKHLFYKRIAVILFKIHIRSTSKQIPIDPFKYRFDYKNIHQISDRTHIHTHTDMCIPGLLQP